MTWGGWKIGFPTFEGGGEGFNQPLFTRTAENLLLPPLEACRRKEERPEIVRVWLASNVTAAVVLKREPVLLLAGISRRLAGRSIRRPFYAEIRRDIPVEVFAALVRAIKNSTILELQTQNCYVKGNKKGEVISLTSLSILTKLFSWLSGKNVRRKLTLSYQILKVLRINICICMFCILWFYLS